MAHVAKEREVYLRISVPRGEREVNPLRIYVVHVEREK